MKDRRSRIQRNVAQDSKEYMCKLACIIARHVSFIHQSSKLDGAFAAMIVDVLQLKLLESCRLLGVVPIHTVNTKTYFSLLAW
jgi:hypothetical protein